MRTLFPKICGCFLKWMEGISNHLLKGVRTWCFGASPRPQKKEREANNQILGALHHVGFLRIPFLGWICWDTFKQFRRWGCKVAFGVSDGPKEIPQTKWWLGTHANLQSGSFGNDGQAKWWKTYRLLSRKGFNTVYINLVKQPGQS